MWHPPRHLLFLRRDGTASYYRLRLRLSGGYRLEPLSAPWARGFTYLLLLESGWPYRRRIRTDTLSRRLLSRLLATMAAESFPFVPEETWYAFGERGGGGASYLFALPREELSRLERQPPLAELSPPRAVIVADAKPAAMLVAVERWLAAGRERDLLGRPVWPIHRGLVSVGVLVVLTLLAGWVGFWHLDDLQERLTRSERQTERRWLVKADELTRRRQVVGHMAVAVGATEDLAKRSGALVLDRLDRMLNAMPDGAQLVRVQLENDGTLVVTGFAREPQAWMDAAGLVVSSLEVIELPERRRFEARLPPP